MSYDHLHAPVDPSPAERIARLREDARVWRAEADRLGREESKASMLARGYEALANDAERELLGREWDELHPGDVITLRVFGLNVGWVRERREVVAVDWPVLTLREDDREYDFDASSDRPTNRDIRLVATRATPPQHEKGAG